MKDRREAKSEIMDTIEGENVWPSFAWFRAEEVNLVPTSLTAGPQPLPSHVEIKI